MNEKKRLSGKTWVKRLLSFVLALAMMVTLLPTSGLSVAKAAETGKKTIYFKPGEWAADNAWFTAWVWGSKEKDAMYKLEDLDGDGYYTTDIPADATQLLFLRKDPATTTVDWSGEWNRTGDLNITHNCFTIEGWSYGSWSDYVPSYTVTGEKNLCGGNGWETANTANDMVLDGESGLYKKTFTYISKGTYQFKVALNHSWNKAWGDVNGPDGNATVEVLRDGSEVTICFDARTGKISTTVTAVYNVEFQGTNVISDGATVIVEGNDYEATLSPVNGYELPKNITVAIEGTSDVSGKYTYKDGKLFIPKENITGNITITAKGIAVYNVTLTGTNVAITGESTVKEGVDYTATLKADEGYLLPEEINVTTNSEAVEHQYNKENGTLTIPAANIKGDLVITAEGQEKPDTKTIYLIPGVWETDGAWFAAWVWKTGEEGVEYRMSDEDANGSYQVEIPYDADKVIFIRNNPEYSNVNWDNVWNKTGNLTIDGTCYTMTGWETGSWSNEIPAVVDVVYTVVGAPELCGSNWTLSDSANDMSKNETTGLYEKTFSNVINGTHEFKIAANHSWDKSWGLNGTSANTSVKVETVGSTVVVTFDASTRKITTTVTPPPAVYGVTFNGTNVTSTGVATVTEGNDYTATLQVESGFDLPSEIAVMVGDQKLTTDDYSYDSATGELTIKAEAITGDVTITAAGVKNTITVYFRNDWLWPEVNIHYWNEGKTVETTWPGETMTKVDTMTEAGVSYDVYAYELPNWAVGIVFSGIRNEGTDRQQTPDILSGIEDGNAYTIHWYNNANAWKLIEYPPTGGDGDEDDTPVPKSTYTVTFHFANTIGWSPLNLYVWNDDGATTGVWPGTAVTKQDENGYHTMTVTYETAVNAGLNYIFNNGSSQTKDLNVDVSAFDATTNTAELWIELDATPVKDGDNDRYVIKQVANKPFDNVALAVSPQINGSTVTFEYVNASATSVEVRGNIPGATWNQGIAMSENAKGIWTVDVVVTDPAVYEYKFVVNGTEWYADPANGKTNGDGNSVFTITDPTAQDNNEVKINVFYKRGDDVFTVENADGADTGVWNAYVWGDGVEAGRWDFATDVNDLNGNDDTTEMVTTITVKGRECQNVYLKPRMSTSTKDWLQEESQVSISVGDIVSGTINVYVISDGTDGNKGDMRYSTVTGTDIVVGNKIVDVQYDYDNNKIKVTTLEALADTADLVLQVPAGSAVVAGSITSSGTTYTMALNKNLDLVTLYQYKVAYDGYEYEIGIDTVYASNKFAADYTYTEIDKALGATWSEASTTFKVWAPTAEAVSVNLYASGTKGTNDLIKSVPMTKGDKGVWTVTVDGDLNGTYYTYSVKVNGETVEAVDPYARTTGVNGNRGMVIDLESTDPKDGDGWTELANKPANYTDAVIYELHVRDFSIDDSSGIKDAWKGKFLGLTEAGTKIPGTEISTGLDYLKNLGITHLHLLPIYDYASVKEDKLDTPQFNWGYDPQNYNAPEGSYSTNPYDGATRVKEMKEMVDTLHENGIGVIMDVVYNHVYDADTFSMNLIVPGYFSRVDSNRSGCGNDTASEREMVRKFIVESVLYWAEEYHIDGFRFDLVGLLDVETINQIVTEVHKHREDIIFYGEGWDMDDTNREPGTEMAKQGNASKTPGFGYFSDSMRNLLGGSNGSSLGFVSGQSGQEGALVNNYKGNPGWTQNPEQVVQYASCHDNYTLIDKLLISTGKSKLNSEVAKMSNLAAVVYMTSQGIPFIHAGEEMLREKIEEDGGRCENSYNASDFVNHIEWSNLTREEYANNSEYYKGLIEFRKAHPALRMTDSDKINQSVQVMNSVGKLVVFAIDGQASGDASDIYVIFNANASMQTVNLPEGEWTININDTKAGTDSLGTVSGSVDVAGISAMVLTRANTGKDDFEPVEPTNTITLYFTNNKGWSKVYAYTFANGQTVGAAWPGTEMTYVETNDYGEDIYSIKVSASATHIIFNNGNGTQTVDLTAGVDGTGYYCTTQSSGKWNCDTYKYRDPEPGAGTTDNASYYLIGYIDNSDYTGKSYKFDAEGKITTTFSADSYVYVVNGNQSETYMTQGWLGGMTSATLYEISKNSLTADKWDKMMIPGGVEVTITMVKNNDDTVTLSYEAQIEPGVEDQSGIQDGVTLHAWNWSFAEIEKNMKTIADMGFTAIQTSPVQPVKESTNDAGDNVGDHWWLYYQPVDFVITDQEGNALGTKDELKSMIEVAHSYGIQVIVDVVANHLANQTGNNLSDQIPEYLKKAEYWHDITVNISNWEDRDEMTQNCMDGLPDLNTANEDIQQYVLEFLKECVDIGVDGFRFDAAKSIETPDDDSWFDSDFWPTVIGGAESYALTEYNKDLYMYGEILDNPHIALSAYTKYMSITDNSWGNALRNNVAAGNAALNAGYNKAAEASNLVLWAESHDTYMTGDEAQTSYGVSEADINKTWALVAARADAMGLYFARPESIEQALGVASATGWDNPEVQAVNIFHNEFVSETETVGNDGVVSYVLRGESGIVLVKVGEDSNDEICISNPGLKNGTYVDQITGNSFVVDVETIVGIIGATGIAVVYDNSASIEEIEDVEEMIEAMPAPETIEPGDDEAAQAVQDIVEEFEKLESYERTQVDEELQEKLAALVAAVASTDYKIIEGHGQQWEEDSEHNLRFRSNGHFSKFKGIRINGTPIDTQYYTAQAGSTIIVLHADFLDTLPIGQYELEVMFEDDGTMYFAKTTFMIRQEGAGQGTPAPEQPQKPSESDQPQQQPGQSTNAPTGDNSPILLYSVMALAALAVIAEAERRKRRA